MDIWEDLDILKFIQHGEYPPQVTSSHWDCIQQWSKRYSWRDNHLIWCLPQGDKVVPPPHEQLSLIQKVHLELGHLELSILITFLLLITIREICMLKSEASLLGVNNVIEWELPFPLDSSRFLHSLFKACFIIGHVIKLESYHRPLRVMSTSWLWLSIFQSGSSLLRYQTSHHTAPARFSYNRF